jgi:acylphosphatase
MRKQAEIIIKGRVQGVFFRQKTKAEAEKLALLGWVRNEEDGSVRIVIEGEEEKIKEFIAWAKEGPRFARVENIQVGWQSAKNEFSQFEILM